MENRKGKHICIVSPSLKLGGIERALSVLANNFFRQGYKVTFISCLKTEHFYTLDLGIKVIEPDFLRTASVVNKISFYPRLAVFIRKNVKAVNPDVVLSFGDWFNPLVLFALYGLKYPVYISDRTSPDYKFDFGVRLAKRMFYPTSSGFIAQTGKAAEHKVKDFGKRLNVAVIPNAIREITKYDTDREKIVLYVGRFAWEKGPERLIRAFAQIENGNGWRLEMAGEGPLLDKMKTLSAELGIADRVVFHGKVSNVDALFFKSSIFVLPSLLEGFPNALCEAMAAGLPCICFDSIAYGDLFTPNISGIVVPEGDINALSLQLSELMNNPDKREAIGNEASKIAAELKADKIGERILAFMNL